MASNEGFLKEFANYCRELESSERRTEDASTVMNFIQSILDDTMSRKLPVRPIKTQLENKTHQNSTGPEQHMNCVTQGSKLSLRDKDEKISLEEALDVFRREVYDTLISPLNGSFFGYVSPPTWFTAQLMDSMGTFLSIVNVVNHATPGACDLELHVLTWLCSIIGYEEGSCGYFTSSSTIATIHAIMVARDERLNSAKEYDSCVVYMSVMAHRANWMSLKVAGLGGCQIRKLTVDKSFKLNAVSLEEAIQQDIKDGYNPFMVIGTAGTTEAGSIDPLEDIARIAKKFKLWFHVDGAIGAVCMVSKHVKHLMRGIEMSDSVSLSLHKAFNQPSSASAVLLRDGQKLMECMTTRNPSYLKEDASGYSPINYTFETSRPFRGLSLWFCVKIFGKTFFEELVDEKLYLAQYLQEKLTQIPLITVYTKPELPIVLFRYVPLNRNTEEANVKLGELWSSETEVFLQSVCVCGTTYHRVCIMGQRSHIQEIDALVETVKAKVELLNREDPDKA